mmetsp:Transcript_9422/g.16054  ORF Transcript_9422/g.16054 Transcript_9422/m.16054 type:complete len:89 (-) Transcript_9422:213-479(-)
MVFLCIFITYMIFARIIRVRASFPGTSRVQRFPGNKFPGKTCLAKNPKSKNLPSCMAKNPKTKKLPSSMTSRRALAKVKRFGKKKLTH